MKTIVLFGASSAIAQAYIELLQINAPTVQVICVSSKKADTNSNIVYLKSDYTAQSLAKVTTYLKEQNADIQQVVVFNGTLHNKNHMPEKKLEELNSDYFNELFNSNTLTPLLCLQSILPLLTHKTQCTITALSARVGSINDNKLGGWYTYRASKAALNMLFKTAAVELARRAKNTKLVLFHPGTTDTALSKPFQKNVPADKLFSAEFVAKQLFTLTFNNPHLELNGEPAYLDWQGEAIPW
ncbi:MULTISPECIES: SDR family NAD(P)-dependent oxidoreductase [unclassified Pseudoalteromonas]|jgi:NAD(P)-dependent dehydrogenase (short-subunit alcohol dehydrogenase family)|uniref:SDR family NAD(P)-dependent oxidoreductase n=1 Tax=unclassified Pseudoalteromonas TaxID=194690 RepID=UPI00235A2C4C|nr:MULTISPECIES: SDR family NAD(P)-dependent oxidoreductase [unclassified Pseudoalteromonas]MDC9500344.1 SDR family NAD(P)-dependent oxidoreductase [Pseudoalteromonas sp. Angola-18]MDC9531095.1 SDR family NAD(P)-dependent oxidoreductase [Pseudoalteromonas sp. Angola-7]